MPPLYSGTLTSRGAATAGEHHRRGLCDELLDLASAGEHILVERGRRPLAVLVPYEDALRLQESPDAAKARALAALDRLEAFARRTVAEYPDPADLPDAAQLIRDERSSGHGDTG